MIEGYAGHNLADGPVRRSNNWVTSSSLAKHPVRTTSRILSASKSNNNKLVLQEHQGAVARSLIGDLLGETALQKVSEEGRVCSGMWDNPGRGCL